MTKYITIKLTKAQFNLVFNTLNDPEAVTPTYFVRRTLRKLLDALKEQTS